MHSFSEIFDTVFLGNTLEQYCWFAGIILLGIIFKRYISKLVNRLLYRLFKKYSSHIPLKKFHEYLHKPTALFFLLVFVYIGFMQLEYPASWKLNLHHELAVETVIEKAFLTLIISSFLWICIRIMDVVGYIIAQKAEKAADKSNTQVITFLTEVLKVIVIIIGIFLLLGTVFNLNVGSLIAGLGIGGLAVALAAKETLENLLGSFTIFLDKPFAVGDYVKVGDITGTVEKIGFRSTRLRTPGQSYITVPNKKMVDAELDNLSMRKKQMVNFNLSLSYATGAEQLKAIISDIRSLIAENALCTDEPLVSLSAFAKSAFEIMVLYYVDTPDYNLFIKTKEEINFKILETVKRNKASFAFANATVYLDK
jgi:MscS family membrane protein